MKCLCGYEYESLDEDTEENKPFTRITGSTFKRRSSLGYGHEEEIYLYVCPKCSTVRMDQW
jgi:hypothetical protein